MRPIRAVRGEAETEVSRGTANPQRHGAAAREARSTSSSFNHVVDVSALIGATFKRLFARLRLG